ncbi:hypothetical protein TNCV_4257031 [Trichonephila clavipes]|nr:hypothetical protein TNCV_4257031 [Trichonephila clavipes]
MWSRQSTGQDHEFEADVNSLVYKVHVPMRSYGSLMVKVTDSWPACHEFEPRTAVVPPCRDGQYMSKYVEAQTSFHWCGGEVRRGRCTSSDDGNSYEDISRLLSSQCVNVVGSGPGAAEDSPCREG